MYNLQSNSADFYIRRTQELLSSGYPVDIVTIDYSTDNANIICWHKHDEIEFQYILEGQISIYCDEDTICANKGDIVFINQGIRHFSSSACSQRCLTRSIIANPTFIFGFGQSNMHRKFIYPVIHCSTLKSLLITPTGNHYTSCYSNMQEIFQLNQDKPSGYELLTKAHLLQLWKLLYDNLPASDTAPPHIFTQDEQRVKSAVSYIHQHFREPITLEDIANSILVSKSECCRCFKRVMNATPFEYLLKYRILETARQMHQKTNASISEIAGSAGFNNTSYYNKILKKLMGCTPTQYRQSVQ